MRKLVIGAALLLSAPALAGDVSGVITGPGGAPIPGMPVEFPDVLRGDVTGADGSFSIADVPAGEQRMEIGNYFFASSDVTVHVPEHGEVFVEMEAGPNMALQRAAAAYVPPEPTHLPQKQAFLAGIGPAPEDAPNVVVIFFDDLGYGDLSSFGNRLIDTPHIDGWGAAGMTLTQFYSAHPVCTPSRAGLMTGRYPSRALAANHVFFPSGHPLETMRQAAGYTNALPRDEILLSEMLGAAGYATGIFGKWHLGDYDGHRPAQFGFSRSYGILYSNDMFPLPMWADDEIVIADGEVEQGTLSERFTDEAVDFIRANADGRFFAYIPYTAPHLPHVPHPDHAGVSDGGTYGDVIEELDRNVGRVRAVLDELGIAEDTLVIITSDNGGDWGGSAGPLRGRKAETWDGGMRVPFFAIWPGHIAPGTSSEAMAMNIDIVPTVARLAGISLPADRVIDGADLAPLLWGEGGPEGGQVHDYLYYLTAMSGEFQAVRSQDYKYRAVLAQRSFFAPTGAVEFYMASDSLYDLANDNEAHDVTARHPQTAAELAAQLEEWRAQNAANPRGWID